MSSDAAAAASADTKDTTPAAAAAAAAAGASANNVLSTPQKLSAGAARAAGLHTPITPGQQLAKPRHAPAGTPGQSATLKRALEAQEWTAELAVDLSKWFVHVLGPTHTAMGDVQTADDFYARLQSGVELCNVVNTIAPDYALPVNPDAKPKSFPAHDNVELFLKAAKAIGVNSVSLFEVDDLMDRKNDKLVVNTLLQLSDCAHEQFGVPRVELRDELRAALFGSPTKSSNAAAKLRGQATPAPASTGTAVTAAAHGVAADNAVVGSAHKRGASRVVGHARGAHTGAVGVHTSAMVAGVESGDDDDAEAAAAARADEHNRRHHRSGSGDDVAAREHESVRDGWGYRSGGGGSSDSGDSDDSSDDSDSDDDTTNAAAAAAAAAAAGKTKAGTTTADASAQTDDAAAANDRKTSARCSKCGSRRRCGAKSSTAADASTGTDAAGDGVRRCGDAKCDGKTTCGGAQTEKNAACQCGTTCTCTAAGGGGGGGGVCKCANGCTCDAAATKPCGGGGGCGAQCGGGQCGVSGCHGCACKPKACGRRRRNGGGGGGFFADDNLKVLVGLALTATHAFFYFNKRK